MRTADNHTGWCVEIFKGTKVGWLQGSPTFNNEATAIETCKRWQAEDPAHEYRTNEVLG